MPYLFIINRYNMKIHQQHEYLKFSVVFCIVSFQRITDNNSSILPFENFQRVSFTPKHLLFDLFSICAFHTIFRSVWYHLSESLIPSFWGKNSEKRNRNSKDWRVHVFRMKIEMSACDYDPHPSDLDLPSWDLGLNEKIQDLSDRTRL